MTLRRNRWFAAFCTDIVFSIQSNAADAYNLGGARSSVPNGAGSQIEPVRWCYLWDPFSRHDVYFTNTPMKIVTILLISWHNWQASRGEFSIGCHKKRWARSQSWEAQGGVQERHRVFQRAGRWSCKGGRQGPENFALISRTNFWLAQSLDSHMLRWLSWYAQSYVGTVPAAYYLVTFFLFFFFFLKIM